MEGTFLVLRTDLVVFIPGAALSDAAAHAFFDNWRQAVEGSVRIVVMREPVRVIDARDADPALIQLAESLAERYPVAAGS